VQAFSQLWSGFQDLIFAALSYLEQLFGMLRRAGLVESARGRAGGDRLARDAGSVSIAEVMGPVEEPVKMTACSTE